ncbi:MFS transporter [Sphingobium sufflavum]|uniref:spinster family MFS transporter n=1 Tax=Sphingobium sufflavum TaxID=1129547 RepID=UPI001F31572A|nr:MFS transporter [Sphingobium sufflavum]MCE7797939.1 MFS transporter [Sphingobium sufflavum]
MASEAHREPVTVDDGAGEAGRAAIPRYAWYALAVVAGANLLNYLDRYILSILAQSIKADLKLDDAQLGFLLGTAFAVFYAVVGIAMGRIADRVSRRKLMAFGVALWSIMTALGGAATNFLWLSAARIGVGVGEATANPCSHALLSDIFPPRNRAMALAVYLSGSFLGSAGAMILGGLIVQHWGDYCQAVPLAGACDVAGWQAALILVGLPGIPLALLLLGVKEPFEPKSDGQSVVRIVVTELAASLPPFTLFTIKRIGGPAEMLGNLRLIAIVTVVAAGLVWLTGDVAQWVAASIGIYAVVTWGQVQKIRDRPLFALTFGCRTFILTMLGAALLGCIGGGVNIWAAPYAMRTFALSPVQAGVSLGLLHAAAAVAGVLFGGWLTDRIKLRDRRAPIWVALFSLIGELPFLVVMLLASGSTVFLAAFVGFAFFSSLWGGAFAALGQDLVLPRMRGAAASAFSLFAIVVSSGAGPYWAGKVSALTGSLQAGLFSLMLLVPVVIVLFLFAMPRVAAATPESRRTLATAAGEPE